MDSVDAGSPVKMPNTQRNFVLKYSILKKNEKSLNLILQKYKLVIIIIIINMYDL